jgi:hypothetical protein
MLGAMNETRRPCPTRTISVLAVLLCGLGGLAACADADEPPKREVSRSESEPAPDGGPAPSGSGGPGPSSSGDVGGSSSGYGSTGGYASSSGSEY